MNRIEKTSVRLNPAELSQIDMAAEEAGLTRSEFIRRAALKTRPDEVRGEATELVRPACSQFATPSRPLTDMPPFRAPFLRGLEGVGFERAVRHAARMMSTDEHTMAIAITHFFEAVANALASGQIVRIPGVLVAGPYRSRSKRTGEEQVYPRFQAAPPLSRDVNERCPPELAKNDELDRHFRRSRRAGVQSVREVMETTRAAITNQDLKAMKIVEDYWRYETAAHAI